MDLSPEASWILIPIQIFFLDLLLGADNAVVIALACRSLHPDQSRKAVLIGTGGAVIFRFLMTIAAGFLLATPYLKLAGASVLMVIAINLVAQEEPDRSEALADGRRASPSRRAGLWSAALLIIVVDAAMSLDNVVALAAIARGNVWLLAVGVLFSIPVLVSGSLILANLLQRHPALVTFGCGVLGWVAGDMAIADASIAGWANAHAPALVLIAPLLGALYVVIQAGFMAQDRRRNANANGARALAPARDAPRPSRARPAIPPVLAPRDPETVQKSKTAAREKQAARPGLEGPAGVPEAPAALAPRRNRSEERVVIIGLIILAVLAGGMIAYVAYLDNLLAR